MFNNYFYTIDNTFLSSDDNFDLAKNEALEKNKNLKLIINYRIDININKEIKAEYKIIISYYKIINNNLILNNKNIIYFTQNKFEELHTEEQINEFFIYINNNKSIKIIDSIDRRNWEDIMIEAIEKNL